MVAICAAFPLHAHFFTFAMDDAFISLRYAQNLVDGHGLVFNAGERVEGYSNFSWTIVLALLLKAGLPPIESARWLGVALAALSGLVAARFARGLAGRWGPASAGTAALVAASTPLAYWSASGMETALFVLLVTGAVDLGLAPDVRAKGRRLAPVLFALAALTRPDGPLFFFVWLALRAFGTVTARPALRDERGLRGVAVDLGVFLALVAPHILWKISYYGDLLPNTYYAKAGFDSTYLMRGIAELRDWLGAYQLWGLVPLVSLFALRNRDLRSTVAAAMLLILTYCAYVVVIGGDVLPVFRFWLTVVPLGSALVVAGVMEALRHVGLRRGRDGVALGLVGALALVGILRNDGWIQERRQADLRAFDKVRSIALWMKERLEPGALIASTSNGAIAWYSGHPILDMLGLTDAEVARSPQHIENLTDTWKEKKYNAASVLDRRPAVIVFSTGVRPSAMAEKALFLYEDFHASYTLWDFRYAPSTTSYHAVYRLRPDAPPPPPQQVPTDKREFLATFERGLREQTKAETMPQAMEDFAETVRIGPPWFRMARAWLALMADDLRRPDAAALLERAVREDSLATRAICRLGVHRLDEDNLEEAHQLFWKATQANPDWPAGWEGLAMVAARRGELEPALGYSARSLQLWNTNLRALMIYGSVALQLGRPDRAEQAFRRALRLRPGFAEAEAGLDGVRKLRRTSGPPPEP